MSEDSAHSEDVERLCKRVLEVIQRRDDSQYAWHRIWRIIIADPWYQSELGRSARIVVRESGAPRDWRHDIEQDAILLLARTLRQSPDLHAEVERLQFTFLNWMRTIIRRHCLEAVRKRHSRDTRPCDVTTIPDRRRVLEEVEIRMDVASLCDRFPKRTRVVLLLWLSGHTLEEIADELELSYITVRRELDRARERIRQELDLE